MPVSNLKAKFNDTSDPSYSFKDQCVCFKRVCDICGHRFEGTETKCPVCGALRPRCQHKAMKGEEVCRMHSKAKPYSLYTKLSASISDAALEEFIEKENNDLEQEFALARLALSGALDNQKLNSKTLMHLVKVFFEVAEKKKNVEKGQQINISWNDELAASLRKRFRFFIKSVNDVLSENIEDKEKVQDIMEKIKEKVKMKARF